MNTLTDEAVTALFADGQITIRMKSEAKFCFPIADNPRLAKGNAKQLNHIELSPFGIHWLDLDEDLSFRGILEGNHGQQQKG